MTRAAISVDAIPAELKAERRWVVARIETRDGKPTKVPYCSFDLTRKASSTDPATWSDFETAWRVVETGRMPMLGYMLECSGRFGIDLDKCRDPATSVIEPWAVEIIELLDSYTEASVSGTGVHIIANGALPPGRRRTGKDGKCSRVPAGRELEAYDSGRYFVMTGVVIREAGIQNRTAQVAELHARLFGAANQPADGPSPQQPAAGISDDDALLRRIRASKQAEKFEKLWGGDTSLYKGDDSAADQALCTILAFWTQRDRERMDRLFRQSGLYRQKWDRADYREETLDRACAIKEVYEPQALILDPGDPLNSARKFVARHLTVDGVRALQHQHGVFYQFDLDASAYYESDEPSVRAALYRFLDHAKCWNDDGKIVPFKPTKSKVEGVLDALHAICNLPTSRMAPCWLRDDPGLNPLDMLACRNGLLHAPTRTLYPATPNFFVLNGLDFAHDPQAPAAVEWGKFLRSIWSDDPESIEALQETFGYYLTPDTRFQKIHMIVGPKRSGKGTIARVLRHLVGGRNTCSPTLAAFGRDFGKQVLIDKTVAIISDARISGRTDTSMVAETLLSISGEDSQTIPRKFLPDWNGKLPVRFLLLANELPRIGEASGALTSRFILLVMKESFFGKEDLGLFDRLVQELPGILNWALEGRDRLYARGYFVQPPSADEMIREFDDLSSPIGAFLRDRCEQHVGAELPQVELFKAWFGWCQENGIEHAGAAQSFGRSVRAALPWIATVQHRHDERGRCWTGLRLKDEEQVDGPPAYQLEPPSF